MNKTKTQLIKRLLDEKAEENNQIDLNAYAMGLDVMYEAITVKPCCVELKVDKKLTFLEYSRMFYRRGERDIYENNKTGMLVNSEGVFKEYNNYKKSL